MQTIISKDAQEMLKKILGSWVKLTPNKKAQYIKKSNERSLDNNNGLPGDWKK
ncbi:MAG: hypothetical protein Q7T79_01610 [bacterium]|nr:hypothetical protein [bacterium]